MCAVHWRPAGSISSLASPCTPALQLTAANEARAKVQAQVQAERTEAARALAAAKANYKRRGAAVKAKYKRRAARAHLSAAMVSEAAEVWQGSWPLGLFDVSGCALKR